jgi:hypothetical protein
MVTCDGSGDVVPVVEGSIEPNWPKNKTVTIPLCKNNPGNVGWLDWSPKAGGTSELIDAILTPSNPAIDLPSWQYITETGNPNSKGVEDAINTYIGQVVLFPMFDLTCKDDPNFSLVNSPSDPNKGCPAGSLGGNGPNQWYRIPQFAALRLERAYVNGNNKSSCEENGNGAISCLVGQFVDFVTEGTVGPGFGGGNTLTGVLGVQLIK